MSIHTKLFSLTCLVFLAFGSVGCSDDDPVESIDQYTDCLDVCNAYADCLDSDYDVDACEDRCTDDDYKNDDNRLDDCENCLDDRSCSEQVFQCSGECALIVP